MKLNPIMEQKQKLLMAQVLAFFKLNPDEELLEGDIRIKYGADQATVANVLAELAAQRMVNVTREGHEWKVGAA